jgi:hypothetical protein
MQKDLGLLRREVMLLRTMQLTVDSKHGRVPGTDVKIERLVLNHHFEQDIDLCQRDLLDLRTRLDGATGADRLAPFLMPGIRAHRDVVSDTGFIPMSNIIKFQSLYKSCGPG